MAADLRSGRRAFLLCLGKRLCWSLHVLGMVEVLWRGSLGAESKKLWEQKRVDENLSSVLVEFSGKEEKRQGAHRYRAPHLFMCCLASQGHAGVSGGCVLRKPVFLNICVQQDFVGFLDCKSRGDRLVATVKMLHFLLCSEL